MPGFRVHKNWPALLVMAIPLALVGGLLWAHEPAQRAFLGVALEEETEHPEGGARITQVIGDSAAEEAGLRKGDIIVRFDGRTVRGPGAVTRQIREREAGDLVEIVVLRDGREESFDVELGSDSRTLSSVMPELELQLDELDRDLERELDFHFEQCEDDDCRTFAWSFSDRPRLGVQLAAATPELRTHLGGDERAGVLVTRVVTGSPAEEAGIRVGDLIIAIDGEPVDDAGEIRGALPSEGGATVGVEVIRDHGPLHLDVFLPEQKEREGRREPRSFLFVPEDEVSQEVGRVVREAFGEARRAYREAAREANRQLSTATREARLEAQAAHREARRLYRKAAEAARRQARYGNADVL